MKIAKTNGEFIIGIKKIIEQKSHGQVLNVNVSIEENSLNGQKPVLLIHGLARSYYHKQIAQEALQKFFNEYSVQNKIVVEKN